MGYQEPSRTQKLSLNHFSRRLLWAGNLANKIHIRRCLSSDAVLLELYAAGMEEFLTGSFATHPVSFILHLS